MRECEKKLGNIKTHTYMTKNVEHSSLIIIPTRMACSLCVQFFCTGYVCIEYECGCFLVVCNFSRHLLLRHIAETKSFLPSYYYYRLCLFLVPTVFKTPVFLKISVQINSPRYRMTELAKIILRMIS